LKRIPGELTREALLDAIDKAPFDIGGVTLSFGPAKNQGSDQVYFTILQSDGSFKPILKFEKTTG
jgi:hypothetical protein